MHHKLTQAEGRRGSAAPFLIVSLSVILAAVALAVNPAWLWSNRAELQAAADAVAIAATETLVDDDLLRGDPQFLPGLIARSTAEAYRFANLNVVRGQPFALLPGDILFGTLPAPRAPQFTTLGDVTDPTNALLTQVNAVQVTGRLTRDRGSDVSLLFSAFTGFTSAEIVAQATAMLDQAVVGFRPLPDHPVLLAPLALLSDPAPLDLRSWESQVENKKGLDLFTFNRQSQTFVPGPDGLFEFAAILPLDPANPIQVAAANVAVLNLGVTTQQDIDTQILNGVTADQLPGGVIILPAGGPLSVPGSAFGPSSPTDLAALVQTLQQLQTSAAPRIWPLYTSVSGGTVQVSGFVVARVVNVVPVVNNNQPLVFSLQPTMIAATATALTDPARPFRNRYVCKVRVVQ